MNKEISYVVHLINDICGLWYRLQGSRSKNRFSTLAIYLEAVKSKLKALLASEMTPVSEMSHFSAPKERSLEEEGRLIICHYAHRKPIASKFYLLQWLAM